MDLKENFDFRKANIYVLLSLDAEHPDKIISFAERYMLWRRIDSTINCFRREIKKRKTQDFNILDIGCGNGYLDFKLKNSVPKYYNLKVIGVDKYKPAIDFANTRKKFLHREDCHFELMDACNLRFEDDSFDIVVCSEVLEHLKQPRMAIKEIYRVLKKDGLVIISTPNKRENVLIKIARFILKKLSNYKNAELFGNIEDKHAEFKQEGIRHISVKNHKEWTKIFKQSAFSLQRKIGTGGMLYDYKFWEKHRILFGLMVIFDALLENLPLSYVWSEIVIFELRK
ncbi:MAG: methyltransferase domain-containing protein [Candidatus Aminicenantes bacterium]|nr:methyltransferase domain-containing protein [Candidatus Aminicenantes bacterium]